MHLSGYGTPSVDKEGCVVDGITTPGTAVSKANASCHAAAAATPICINKAPFFRDTPTDKKLKLSRGGGRRIKLTVLVERPSILIASEWRIRGRGWPKNLFLSLRLLLIKQRGFSSECKA